jgi:ankyrin repeat protein
VACLNGHLPVVESLLSVATADVVNFQDRRGQTSLHLSVDTGNIDIVNVLLSRGGANVNVKNNAGKSPLSQATSNAAIFELIQKHLAKSHATKQTEDLKNDDS